MVHSGGMLRRWFWGTCLLALACGAGEDGVANSAAGGGGAVGGGAGALGGSAGSAANAGTAGGAAAAGTGSGGTAGGVSCGPPAGNLLAHGEFKEGMSGLAPTGWEVRTPSQPDACKGSGTPAEHLFLSAGEPACGGQALTIDACGEWDCYAIQRVTDYSSIEGGATYRISARVRSSGNATNPAAWFVLGAQWLDANDGFFGDVKNPQTASAAANDFDWKTLAWDVVAPPNARRMLVWLSAHYPGRVDYDDVSVTKL